MLIDECGDDRAVVRHRAPLGAHVLENSVDECVGNALSTKFGKHGYGEEGDALFSQQVVCDSADPAFTDHGFVDPRRFVVEDPCHHSCELVARDRRGTVAPFSVRPCPGPGELAGGEPGCMNLNDDVVSAGGGSGFSANFMPAVPADLSVTTIAFMANLSAH